MKFVCPNCDEEFNAPRPPPGQPPKCPACGHSFTDVDETVVDSQAPLAAADLAPGKMLEGFLIEEQIGTGAMGHVYKATQLSLKRTVALKVLPPAFVEKPAFVERFYEESMALSALNHPNVVTIIERGNTGDIFYFVMEYVDGPSLLSLMSKEPFEIEQFLKVAKGTAAALAYAHDQGVVHRDVKPANIMLNSQGQIKIADFGLAGLIEQERKAIESGSKQPRRMGTPAYMSPEQKVSPLEVDGRTDIYSAGVVFHQMLTATRSTGRLTEMPSEINEAADPRLDPIIAGCLRQKPDERYQTAAELLADLERFEAELANAPRCPECGKLSPVRFENCMYCDRDLVEFFDVCPDCGQKNRREVRRCLHCGADLERGRTIVREKVSMMVDHADRLRLDGKFDEALETLNEVLKTEGKTFEQQRQRSKELHERIVNERRAAANRAYAEGYRMMRERRFGESIRFFQQVPRDIKDTSKDVKTVKQLQARLARATRSRATTNLILIILGVVMVVGVALFFVLR